MSSASMLYWGGLSGTHRVTYVEIAQPVRLLGFSDSVFKREDEDNTGHAMRGGVIVLANAVDPDALRSGTVQLIDYVSRKQKH
eukprot:6409120-Lingulodinium_polyedra.AAC.1